MKKLLVLTALTLALAAHAQEELPPAPQAAPGEIIIEQRTYVLLGTKGSVTQRYMVVKMKLKGSERTISTLPTSQWTIGEGGKFLREEPRISSALMEARGVTMAAPYHHTRQRLDGAPLGKKTEDGVTITGEWETFGYGPTQDRPRWTERVETWYRIDNVQGRTVLRPHRRETTSPYEHKRVDYTYLQTTRMHTSLFDPNP